MDTPISQPQHIITGHLAANATARACVGGAWLVDLLIQQPTESTYGLRPIHCSWQFGHGQQAEAAAHTQADQLPAGTLVQIHCRGIDTWFGPGNRVGIELTGLLDVHAA